MNPFDSIAVEEALRLRALSPGGEVTAVTIGGKKSAEVLQTALAMGADRVMHVITNNDAIAPLTIARILARIVKEKECNVAMVGKQAIDNDNGQTGSMLSALLSWPQVSVLCQ